ncbi:small serum protein 2-like [Hyla sarda]|uniref:small serum protein 2-like n=1 Tax=Hyla sarda TaxID=327740 RepID=UPI0024C293EF|nr:small serum protein 2-like [Hyla sarda]
MYWKSAEGGLVTCLLAYSFLVSVCNGACVDREPKLSSLGEKPDGCMDGDIKRDLDSTWLKEGCMECTCDSNGLINCCSRTLEPILEDKACEAILNQTTCTYSIKRKDNSPEPCISLGFM